MAKPSPHTRKTPPTGPVRRLPRVAAVPVPFAASDEDSDAEEGSYTKVYPNSSEDEDGGGDVEEGEEAPERCLYAVRRGKYVRNCIFLDWDDCSELIEECDDPEYEIFTIFEDAAEYLTSKRRRTPGKGKRKARGETKRKDVASSEEVSVGEKRGDKQAKKRKKEWELMYGHLQRYHARYGHSHVPHMYEDGSIKLGAWVLSQRHAYRRMQKGKSAGMNQERMDRLEKLGFAFTKVWAAKRDATISGAAEDGMEDRDGRHVINKAKWNARYEQLKRWKEERGTFEVSNTEDPVLANWLKKQRKNHKLLMDGKPSSLTTERLMRLTKLGLCMETKRDHNYWNRMFDELRTYKAEHGHCIVPVRPHTKLRGFVDRQRLEYKKMKEGKPSNLTAEQILKLNELGLIFGSTKPPPTWSQRFEELKRFKTEHGHCVVPRHFTTLGKWVNQQRYKYKLLQEGKPSPLSREQAQQLTDLGMVWKVLKRKKVRAERKTWQERFEELLQYKEVHGHTNVPGHYPGLGNWVKDQRSSYKYMKQGRKCEMTAEKALKLADINFIFEVKPRKKKAAETSSVSVWTLQHAAARAAAIGQNTMDCGDQEEEAEMEMEVEVEEEKEEEKAKEEGFDEEEEEKEENQQG